MEANNKKERKNLFIRFLAVFIVGILLATIPLYFTMKLPQLEDRVTSEELKQLQDSEVFLRDFFAVRMDSVKGLIDSYDSENVDIDKLNADIGFLLSEMEKTVASDTTWRLAMYTNIVQSYLSLKKSKTDLIDAADELSDCEGDLKSAKDRMRAPAGAQKKNHSLDD